MNFYKTGYLLCAIAVLFIASIIDISHFSVYFFRDYVFELWVEEQKVLGNMSLTSAISSFLHLCFSFDLKYPKVKLKNTN